MIMNRQPLVRSIREKCKVCYTCVRQCPAKAIRIEQGQAGVIPERCIGCGNCIRVCSQNAKEVVFDAEKINAILDGRKGPPIALMAPSFPVEFDEFEDYRVLVGMVKKLGFSEVVEVAFGADLVAAAYNRLLKDNPDKKYIATTCPAVVNYVQFYFPNAVQYLAQIVSPMVAAARVLRKIHENCSVVFIGPCIAKKTETEEGSADEMDGVVTFAELRQLFEERGVTRDNSVPCDFDPPKASRGVLFPISRGLLDVANLREDLIEGDILTADGQVNFTEAIKEFQKGGTNLRLLEVLSCHGCIMGAGITRTEKPLFERRANISRYAKQKAAREPARTSEKNFADVDLSRTLRVVDRRIPDPAEERIHEVLERLGKFTSEDELNCGACGYDTCRDHAKAILTGLAENEMCLPYTIDKLKVTIQKLADSNEEVATIQNALSHSEKLASMGQLAAGVAHEVNNPLGVVLMYSHLLNEQYSADPKFKQYVSMIVEQADRCRRIISGLLNFARQNKTICQPVNMVDVIRKSIRSVNLSSNIRVEIIDKMKDPVIEIDQDQVAQGLINLYTNAQAAMPMGGVLTVKAEDNKNQGTISVSDTGTGIPEKNLPRIFDPFFTTKQIGKGTGLGLAVLYGITKMHNGHIKVSSNDDPAKGPTGTTFVITLPRRELARNIQATNQQAG
jgi:signal transduction histidine kinase/Fe-S-cluster-containing hydrogenase component 2